VRGPEILFVEFQTAAAPGLIRSTSTLRTTSTTTLAAGALKALDAVSGVVRVSRAVILAHEGEPIINERQVNFDGNGREDRSGALRWGP
jgi:hypothetical protein